MHDDRRWMMDDVWCLIYDVAGNDDDADDDDDDVICMDILSMDHTP